MNAIRSNIHIWRRMFLNVYRHTHVRLIRSFIIIAGFFSSHRDAKPTLLDIVNYVIDVLDDWKKRPGARYRSRTKRYPFWQLSLLRFGYMQGRVCIIRSWQDLEKESAEAKVEVSKERKKKGALYKWFGTTVEAVEIFDKFRWQNVKIRVKTDCQFCLRRIGSHDFRILITFFVAFSRAAVFLMKLRHRLEDECGVFIARHVKREIFAKETYSEAFSEISQRLGRYEGIHFSLFGNSKEYCQPSN